MSAAERYDPKIFDRLDELPTLPSIVYELSRIISDPMSSTKDIEALMSSDQSMTTKVLKLANSAYYAIPGGVSSLQRAIAYIGYDAIHQLVLSASILDALATTGPSSFDLNQFWKHAVGVAMASEIVAKHMHYATPSDLFTAGLVHDMGKIAIYRVAPQLFMDAVNAARTDETNLHEAEEQYGFPRHTLIGHQLAERWRLPAQIRAVVLHHHTRDHRGRVGLSSDLNNVVDIVYLANSLVNALRFGDSGHAHVGSPPPELLDRMYIRSEDLTELVGKIKGALASAESFLKIIGR